MKRCAASQLFKTVSLVFGEKKALCQFTSDARKHDVGVEFKDNNKKSIFEVRKNLNYLLAATGLILDIWGLIGSFFFAQASLHSRAASFQHVPDMLQISNRNWTSQTEWRSDIIMWQNPCFRSTVLLRRLNLNLGL